MSTVPERRNFDKEIKKLTDKIDMHIDLYNMERAQDRDSTKQLKDSVNAVKMSLDNINNSVSTLNQKIETPLDVYEKVSITAESIKKVGKFTVFLAVFITTVSAAWYSITHFGQSPKP